MTGGTHTPGRAAWWLPRIVGTALITEQSAGHLLGIPGDVRLLGLGTLLLTGKEGWAFIQLILGRLSGPSDPPPGSSSSSSDS